MTPTVLHFIVCDRVRVEPENLHAISVDGLKWSIRSKEVPPFPFAIPHLTTLAIFMGGDGRAEFSIRIVDDDSQRLISQSEWPHPIRFAGDPHDVNGMKVFVENSTFPSPGLYWVELVFSGSVIARQPVRVYSEVFHDQGQ